MRPTVPSQRPLVLAQEASKLEAVVALVGDFDHDSKASSVPSFYV